MLKITYRKQALKALRRMGQREARLVRSKIQAYATNPSDMAANVKKMQGVDAYRLRVGNWRVIFNSDGVVLDVIKIGPRGQVYKRR